MSSYVLHDVQYRRGTGLAEDKSHCQTYKNSVDAPFPFCCSTLFLYSSSLPIAKYT